MLPVKPLLKCYGKVLAEVLVQIILEFEGGLKLAFCDPRRFGRIRLQEDPANNEPISKLGFDPVLEMISLEDLTARLAAQRRAIKTVILDQVSSWLVTVIQYMLSRQIKDYSTFCANRCRCSKIMYAASFMFTETCVVQSQSFSAGVGNWVADEILHQARIHPEQKANSLGGDQVAALHHQMQVPDTATCIPSFSLLQENYSATCGQRQDDTKAEILFSAGCLEDSGRSRCRL